MRPDRVSAVIVTRGNVDLAPILDTLPYGEVIVWDNSQREDAKIFGRFLAIAEAKNEVIYFQDDDVLFTAHDSLLAAYVPGQITTNMPSPWYEDCGYDKIKLGLVGAGSLVPRDLPWAAFEKYLSVYPKDDLFLTYCDIPHGILTPSQRWDFGYTVLDHALSPGRVCNSPNQMEKKTTMIERALQLR